MIANPGAAVRHTGTHPMLGVEPSVSLAVRV
jgi:hypothetical protein